MIIMGSGQDGMFYGKYEKKVNSVLKDVLSVSIDYLNVVSSLTKSGTAQLGASPSYLSLDFKGLDFS